MNSENSKLSDPHRLLLKFLDKINKYKYVALSNLSTYYACKNIKKSFKKNKFETSVQRAMKNLNYLMDCILYKMFKIILNIFSINMKHSLIILQ